MGDRIAGVLGQQAVFHFGLRDTPGSVETLGDVAEGEADQIDTGTNDADVEAAILAEHRIEQFEVVEDHRLSGVHAVDVLLEQLRTHQSRLGLYKALADDVSFLRPAVGTEGAVCAAVHEVDRPTAGIADRLQQRLRIEHAVDSGAQSFLCGRDALCSAETLGDVAPGEADQIDTGTSGTDVVASPVVENLVEIREVVEYDGRPGLHALAVSPQQPGTLQVR